MGRIESLRRNEYHMRLNCHTEYDRGRSIEQLNNYYIDRANLMIPLRENESLIMCEANADHAIDNFYDYILENDYEFYHCEFMKDYVQQDSNVSYRYFVKCKDREQLNLLQLIFPENVYLVKIGK